MPERAARRRTIGAAYMVLRRVIHKMVEVEFADSPGYVLIDVQSSDTVDVSIDNEGCSMSVSERGYHVSPEEEVALRGLHLRGIRTFRYDGPPDGQSDDIPCPCTLVRENCPQDGRNLAGWCAAGEGCLAGHDHLDVWYVGGALNALVHYPYRMAPEELGEALTACSGLGLALTIEGHSVHNPRETFAVVIRKDKYRSTA